MSQLTLNDIEVQRYDEFKGDLTQDQRHKAELLVLYDCLRYIGDKFVCLPLNTETRISWCGYEFDKKPYKYDYNSTTYLMTRDQEFGFRCKCQGFTSKEKKLKAGLSPNTPFCSHLLALMMAFKNKRFNNEKSEVRYGGKLQRAESEDKPEHAGIGEDNV